MKKLLGLFLMIILITSQAFAEPKFSSKPPTDPFDKCMNNPASNYYACFTKCGGNIICLQGCTDKWVNECKACCDSSYRQEGITACKQYCSASAGDVAASSTSNSSAKSF